MGKLVEDKQISIPGQKLYDGTDYTPGYGTFYKDKTIRSTYLGATEFRDKKTVKVVPIHGKYLPQKNDNIIGEIKEVSYSNWTVDLNSPYDGILPLGEAVDEYIDLSEDDLATYFDIGDLVMAKIQKVTQDNDVQLSMNEERTRQLKGGRIAEVTPAKVPRLIGREGSMINMIKKKTDCTIIVGQNGRVWVNGERERLAVKAVRKVDKEAHTTGLTDRMDEWLDEKTEK